MRRIDHPNQDLLSDAEVEALLSRGSNNHDDIRQFIEAIASFDLGVEDNGFAGTRLSTVASSAATRRHIRLRRTVSLATAGALVFAFAATGLASNSAAPGDFLYSIDRTLEKVGVNDGGFDERIAEYDQLIENGETEIAHTFLGEVVDSADELETQRAIDHLTPFANTANAADAQERVAQIQEFITENKGAGIGLDGRDFGQGVADIATSKPKVGQSKTEKQTGPPDHAGPKDDMRPGKPDNAGPNKGK